MAETRSTTDIFSGPKITPGVVDSTFPPNGTSHILDLGSIVHDTLLNRIHIEAVRDFPVGSNYFQVNYLGDA